MNKFRLSGYSFLVILAIFFSAKGIRSWTVVDRKTELKTNHFTIIYSGVYESEAAAIAEKLEKNYDRIRNELKDPEHARINVFVHGNQNDFNSATGLNNKANGVSRGPLEFHVLWTNWFNSIFPDDATKTAVHEFTHCVQLNILIQQALAQSPIKDEAVFNEHFEKQFSEKYPSWFWESISIYQAREVNNLSVKYAFRNRPNLISLNDGNQIYNLGYTIVDYIVSEWGNEKLSALILSYADLENVLQVSPEEFENGWHKFVEKNY